MHQDTRTYHIVHQKLCLHNSWWQISLQQTINDTDTLLIKFLCTMAFCHMLQYVEAMPKPHRVDVYTIFGICHVTKPHCIALYHTTLRGHTIIVAGKQSRNSVGRYINVNIDISIFLKYRQHRCILKETWMFFRYFLAIISNFALKIYL